MYQSKQRMTFREACCNSLALSYVPTKHTIILADKIRFYIPTADYVRSDFEFAFQTTPVEDTFTGNLCNKIHQSLFNKEDFPVFLAHHLSHSGLFEYKWIYGQFAYRFTNNTRKKIISEFDKYWNNSEKNSWWNIYESMQESAESRLKISNPSQQPLQHISP